MLASGSPTLSLCRSFFGFNGFCLDGASHPSGSRSVRTTVLSLRPLSDLRIQKIFGSRPCPKCCLQDSWFLANPWWLTAWAVKRSMSCGIGDGTVTNQDSWLLHQLSLWFPVPAHSLSE